MSLLNLSLKFGNSIAYCFSSGGIISNPVVLFPEQEPKYRYHFRSLFPRSRLSNKLLAAAM